MKARNPAKSRLSAFPFHFRFCDILNPCIRPCVMHEPPRQCPRRRNTPKGMTKAATTTPLDELPAHAEGQHPKHRAKGNDSAGISVEHQRPMKGHPIHRRPPHRRPAPKAPTPEGVAMVLLPQFAAKENECLGYRPNLGIENGHTAATQHHAAVGRRKCPALW